MAEAAIRAYYASRNEALIQNARNPLRGDPTRTLSLRNRFGAEMTRRLRSLRNALWDFLVDKDAFGLKDRKYLVPFSKLLGNVQPRQYEFLTDANKLTVFNEWFRQQVEANVLVPSPGTPAGQPWTSPYVESAYRRGQLNAYLSSKEADLLIPAGFGDQTSDEFLRNSFLQPETVSKVQLLGTRAFEQMKGMTATMQSDMNHILAQGIADGRGAEDVANQLFDRLQTISESRALTITRTEIIHAHAEGQLDSFERLGVKELGIRAEWSTAGDDRVCDLCAPLEGQVFELEEARGMIPYHPNCRCSWLPTERAVKGREAEKRAKAARASL